MLGDLRAAEADKAERVPRERVGDREVREAGCRGAVTGEERIEERRRKRDEVEPARADGVDR